MTDHNEVLKRIENIGNNIKDFKLNQEDSILRSKEHGFYNMFLLKIIFFFTYTMLIFTIYLS